MAHSKSAKKSFNQSQVRRMRNKMFRTAVRTKIKKLMLNPEATDKEQLLEDYRDTIRSLDKAVTKGIFHKNTVARKKSRISRKIVPLIKDTMQKESKTEKAE